MKTKAEQDKSTREKQIKSSTDEKRTKTKKIQTRMGYHGKDDEKNLNPEE